GYERPRRFQIARSRYVVDQSSAHDSCSCRDQRRLGELLGVIDVRAEKFGTGSGCAMKFTRRPGLVISCALAAVFLSSATIDAHEIGTTQVSVDFRQGSYDIRIVTDAAALAEKLEAVSGLTRQSESSMRTASALQTILESRDETFRTRVAVAFDGASARP